MKTAVGYHGTNSATAKKLADGSESFKVTRNDGDWLGPGAYFWQDAPERAWYWAKRKFGTQAAVVSARISVNRCLDLLDLIDFTELKEVHDVFEKLADAAGFRYGQQPLTVMNGIVRLPKERKNAFLNDRDQALLQFALPLIEESRNKKIETVRCAFLWGRAVHRTSAFFDWSHVQICVREPHVNHAITHVRVAME